MDILEYGDPAAKTVLIQPVDRRDLAGLEAETAAIEAQAGGGFRLIAVPVADWNRDLSPWPAPAVFGGEDFGGCAEQTLDEILALCRDRSRRYFIGGYSLAGLFALWAVFRTDVFTGAAAASPSVWFPGFLEEVQGAAPRCSRVYLSLGDREEKTRNPVLAAVGERIRTLRDRLTASGTDCVLEWNPGNHFRDPELRTARAFAWLLGRPDAGASTR